MSDTTRHEFAVTPKCRFFWSGVHQYLQSSDTPMQKLANLMIASRGTGLNQLDQHPHNVLALDDAYGRYWRRLDNAFQDPAFKELGTARAITQLTIIAHRRSAGQRLDDLELMKIDEVLYAVLRES